MWLAYESLHCAIKYCESRKKLSILQRNSLHEFIDPCEKLAVNRAFWHQAQHVWLLRALGLGFCQEQEERMI